MKKIVLFVVIVWVFAMLLPTAKAADSTAIELSIQKGLTWLAAQQNPDGSWGFNEQISRTGLAVKKFEHRAIFQGKSPLDPTYQYYPQVKKGLNYLFSTADIIPISLQPAGNPDTDGDGIGVGWGGGETYHSSIALMAIAESNCPDSVVNVPGSPVNGWTYRHVAIEAVDFLAFGQNDAGNEEGGWGYTANEVGWSDFSNTGYPPLALAYAQAGPPEGFSIPIPAFVKTELQIWINFMQCTVPGPGSDDGGAGYGSSMGPCYWVNTYKTGNLLFSMAFVGQNTGVNRDRAVAYLVRHWNDANPDPGWQIHYQGMYGIMKGLMAQGISMIDAIDWYKDFSDSIVFYQHPDGSWGPDLWGDEQLSTAWALLTLERATPPVHAETTKVFIPNTDTCVNPGDYATLPILLQNNPVPFGGFELEVEFDYTAMTFVGADMGELLTDLDSLDVGPPPKHYSWEYFQYRMLPCPICACCKYKILLFGMMDLPNGSNNVGVPIPAGSDGELVLLHFVVNNDEKLRGFKIPVCWEWEGTVVNDTLVEDWDCAENTFSDATGNVLYVSNLLCQYRDSLCDAPTGGIEPVLVFQNGICGQNCGGVDVCPAGPGFCKRGDVNYNTLPYEVADAVLFASYFAQGIDVFPDSTRAYQICATDVNADGRTLTLSDLVYLIRVILHDAVEIPKLAPSSENVTVIISNHTITTECAGSIGAILFEFDGAVVPTLLADKMEMIAKDNKVLVWSREGHSLESSAQVVSFEGDANLTSVTAVDRDSRELKTSFVGKTAPVNFALHPAYPNPFNPSTNLSFTLPEALSYSLKIFNVTGQLVKSYEGMGKSGLNVITWNSKDNAGDDVASGIYFYQLSAGSFSATQKMVVIK